MADIKKRLQNVVKKYKLTSKDLPHPSSVAGKSDNEVLKLLTEIGKAKENQDVKPKTKEENRECNKGSSKDTKSTNDKETKPKKV